MGEEANSTTTPTVDVHYLKSGNYREAACDGAVGGRTPSDKIWVGFYSERLPLPRVVRHQLKPVGDAGEFQMDLEKPPIPLEGRAGIVRNLEFGLYMNADVARELHDWLGKRLLELKGEE